MTQYNFYMANIDSDTTTWRVGKWHIFIYIYIYIILFCIYLFYFHIFILCNFLKLIKNFLIAFFT